MESLSTTTKKYSKRMCFSVHSTTDTQKVTLLDQSSGNGCASHISSPELGSRTHSARPAAA